MTIYSELLREALKTAEDMRQISVDPEDRNEWKRLARLCRKELYKLDNTIKKDLTKNQGFDTMELQHSDSEETSSFRSLKDKSAQNVRKA